MERALDIIILSVFERACWLASELASRGLRVGYIDVSDQLGIHRRSDWEGPFGLHLSRQAASPLFDRQLEFLNLHTFSQMERGFVTWLPEGPVEFGGPNLQYRLKRLGVHEGLMDLMKEVASGKEAESNHLPSKVINKKAARLLPQLRRQESWPFLLAGQFAQAVFDPFLVDVPAEVVDLRDHFWLRRTDGDQMNRDFAWLESKGVAVFPQARLLDISREAKRVRAVEILHKTSGVLTAEQFVWTLTSHETTRLLPSGYNKLYATPPPAADWIWTHFGFDITENRLTQALPEQWVAIADLGLPWAHDNFIVGHRGDGPRAWDLWVRRPMNQRFQRSYIEQLGQRIQRHLMQRMVNTRAQLNLYPLEVEMDEHLLGPPRLPLYSKEKLSSLKPERLSHFHFLSHEQSGFHGLTAHLRESAACIEAVLAQWKKDQLKKQKTGSVDDQSLSTP